jgi:hypothetical protein
MAVRVVVSETLPNTLAQQTYLIGSGLAQGAANLILAKGLAKYPEVPTDKLVIVTLFSIALTFVPVFAFLEFMKRS